MAPDVTITANTSLPMDGIWAHGVMTPAAFIEWMTPQVELEMEAHALPEKGAKETAARPGSARCQT